MDEFDCGGDKIKRPVAVRSGCNGLASGKDKTGAYAFSTCLQGVVDGWLKVRQVRDTCFTSG